MRDLAAEDAVEVIRAVKGVLELWLLGYEFLAFLSGMWKAGSLPRAPFPPYRCVLSPCLITVPYRYTLSLQPGCMWWRLWAVEVACGGGHGGGGVGGGGVDRVVRWGAFFFGVLELRCEFVVFPSGMWK